MLGIDPSRGRVDAESATHGEFDSLQPTSDLQLHFKMTLEDFERSLAEERRVRDKEEDADTQFDSRKRRKHNHHRHRHRDDDGRHMRSKRSEPDLKTESRSRHNETTQVNPSDNSELEWTEKEVLEPSVRGLDNTASGQPGKDCLKRDSWMEESSPFVVEFSRRDAKKPPGPADTTRSKADFQLKIHDAELNKHHLQELADAKDVSEDLASEQAKHISEYVFGDSGASWRMAKLRAIYRRAEESGVNVEAVAAEQYGDLRAFDDAREEETELERRKTYGEGYVVKEKPSGELFQERKLETVVHESSDELDRVERKGRPEHQPPEAEVRQVDQTTLNRLKAQMMKAKLKGSVQASRLEAEYNEALKSAANPIGAATVTLGAMDNRMLAGGRNGEVKAVGTKRGRERGLVEENEDMSVEDMVKQERRTRNQLGGDGQRFAERIAKDAKFDVSLGPEDVRTRILIQELERPRLLGRERRKTCKACPEI